MTMLISAFPPLFLLAIGFIAAAMSGEIRDRSGSGFAALLVALTLFVLQSVLWIRYGYKLAEGV